MTYRKLKGNRHTGVTTIHDGKSVQITVSMELSENILNGEYIIFLTAHTSAAAKPMAVAKSTDARVMTYKYDLLNEYIKDYKIYSEDSVYAKIPHTSFKLYFDTKALGNRNFRDWESQLNYDTLRALGNLPGWEYKTVSGLKERFKFIVHKGMTNISKSKAPKLKLSDSSYGERDMDMALPGFATGYVDFERILYRLKIGEKEVRIPVESFYDSRSRAKDLFKGAYLVIQRS